MLPPLSRTTLHEQIAKALREELAARYAAGDRFPSQNELASRFKVAANTAREAVALLVQEGLLERRFGSGTYVTEQRPETCIGIYTELDIAHPDLSPYFPQIIQSLRWHLERVGCLSRLYLGHTPPYGVPHPPELTNAEFKIDLAARRLRAVVVVGTDAGWFRKHLGNADLPVIDGGTPGGKPLVNYGNLVTQGVQYLAAKGCHRIAAIDAAPAAGYVSSRLRQFRTEAEAAGLAVDPAWIASAMLAADSPESPVAVFRRLWTARSDHPDGLLVLDDMVYRALSPLLLYNNIRVPDDLVVISHANAHDTRPLLPTPACLLVDPEASGKMLAGYALRVLRDPAEPPPTPQNILLHESVVTDLKLTAAS